MGRTVRGIQYKVNEKHCELRKNTRKKLSFSLLKNFFLTQRNRFSSTSSSRTIRIRFNNVCILSRFFRPFLFYLYLSFCPIPFRNPIEISEKCKKKKENIFYA